MTDSPPTPATHPPATALLFPKAPPAPAITPPPETAGPSTWYDRLAACRRMMDAHGLVDWKLRVSSAKARLGSCAYRSRTIRLSRHLLQANDWEQVRDTVLHEIAHALVGPRHNHDRVWKAMAVRVGAQPRSCAAAGEVTMPAHAWVAWCPQCRLIVGRYHRRPPHWRRGYTHRGCTIKVQFLRAEAVELNPAG